MAFHCGRPCFCLYTANLLLNHLKDYYIIAVALSFHERATNDIAGITDMPCRMEET